MAASNPLNIDKATKEELMTLPGIKESWAIEILKRRDELGGCMSEYDLKSIMKIGAQVWGPLISDKVICFGSPFLIPQTRNHL